MLTGIHCAMALFVGFLFYNIGGDAKYMRDNYNFLNYCLLFLMFTSFSAVSITCKYRFVVIVYTDSFRIMCNMVKGVCKGLGDRGQLPHS